jgi:hypothetical protein
VTQGGSLVSKRTEFLLHSVIILPFVLCYPLEPCDPLVIHGHKGLFWDFLKDPADLGKDVCG